MIKTFFGGRHWGKSLFWRYSKTYIFTKTHRFNQDLLRAGLVACYGEYSYGKMSGEGYNRLTWETHDNTITPSQRVQITMYPYKSGKTRIVISPANIATINLIESWRNGTDAK